MQKQLAKYQKYIQAAKNVSVNYISLPSFGELSLQAREKLTTSPEQVELTV